MSKFKILSLQFCTWTPTQLSQLPSDLFYGEICLTKLKVEPFLVGICMGGTLRTPNFKNLSTQLTLQYEIAEEKCNQICSKMKNGKKL